MGAAETTDQELETEANATIPLANKRLAAKQGPPQQGLASQMQGLDLRGWPMPERKQRPSNKSPPKRNNASERSGLALAPSGPRARVSVLRRHSPGWKGLDA
jgi:hypothetical protein